MEMYICLTSSHFLFHGKTVDLPGVSRIKYLVMSVYKSKTKHISLYQKLLLVECQTQHLMDDLRSAETQIICRLCLSSDGEFESCTQETNTSLVEMIDRCLDIKIERGDGLPDTICRNCCLATETFDKFRLLCKQNDIFLHECILPQQQYDCLNSEQRAWDQETEKSEEEGENQQDQLPLNKPSPQNSTDPPKNVCCLQDGKQFCAGEERQTNIILEELEKDWEEDSETDSNCIEKERDNDWTATPWRQELNLDEIINSKADICDASVFEKIDNDAIFEPHQGQMESNIPGTRLLNESLSNPSECTGNFSDDDSSESVEIDVVGLDESDSEQTITDALKLKKPANSEEEYKLTHPNDGIELGIPNVSKTSDGRWKCNLCSSTVKDILYFKRHMLRHRALIPPKCDECGEVFPTPLKLRRHMKKHISSSLILEHSCRHCPQSFRMEHLLMKHSIIAHAGLDDGDAGPSDTPTTSGRKLSSECGRCPRIFKTDLEMEQHYESCAESVSSDYSDLSSGESLPVENTEEDSISSDKLLEKIRRNLRSCILVCPVCHVLFSAVPHLRDHVKTKHNSDKPLKCFEPQCGRLFSRYTSYLSHKRGHNKKYICAHCNRGFPDKTKLTLHIGTHTESGPFICEKCGECCNTEKLWRRHQASHAPKVEFNCDICNRRYQNKSSLLFHKQSHKPEFNFICEKCGRKFQHQRHLKAHVRWHERLQSCDLCDYKTTVPKSFVKHQMSHKTQEDTPATETVLD